MFIEIEMQKTKRTKKKRTTDKNEGRRKKNQAVDFLLCVCKKNNKKIYLLFVA